MHACVCVRVRVCAPFPLLQLRWPRDLYGSGASTVQYSVCMRVCVHGSVGGWVGVCVCACVSTYI